MKLITSLISILALSFATLALAEEQATTSPPPEQRPSAEVEQTTTPAPQPAAATTTSEQPAEKKETTAGSVPNQKRTDSAKVSPAGVTATAPSRKGSVEATLKDNENRWEESYAAHDSSVAQSFVASDFNGVYWDGRVMGKSGVISEIKKDKDTYKSAVNEKLKVRSYGPGVAVIVGTSHEKGTTRDGKPFDRVFRFTDTWVQRGGQWQCVASQVMKLKG
jgi:ketosteroid isomerase-like protein